MIAHLRGTVRSLSIEKVVVEVGGVGYLLSISARTSAQIVMGAEVSIETSLVVREDAMTLYGFLETQERDIFEKLQSVSGIGPKVALAITGSLSPSELALAIESEDLKTIERVPGIGKKGAQRLVLELKGKLGDGSNTSGMSSHSAVRDQLVAALTGLGFSAKDSDEAINNSFQLLSEQGSDPSSTRIDELLKLALQNGRR